MAATRGTETATVASTGPCTTTTTTTTTGPTGPTGPGQTSEASSAASSTAAATGRSTSPEWETSPRRRPPPRPRAESISDSDQTDAVFCDPWLNCSSMHPDIVLVVCHLPLC